MRQIELLAPARNVEIGMEAIRHGADAVYIGGPSFGARAVAGNSVEDIKNLCEFAHIFGAKVYVTLNTIIYDEELQEVQNLVQRLYEAGVDALITQDLALLALELPPIALHASTQMDNCTPERAQMLEKAGYSQIVLARELSLSQINAISKSTSLPLEAFVHGALCVSYSGRCYASEYCFGRSANRGRCAQFCRLAFDLVDAEGKILVADRHLLSLRDMNRSASLEEMMDAGISSFKIEGRLKDASYVKNVTAYYRSAIDSIINRRQQDYCRSSYGVSQISFTPQLEKSFNRGFTDYFLQGRKPAMWNFSTPKSMGEYIGNVTHVSRKSFSLNTSTQINNGDGLAFINQQEKLEGLRANRVEGREIFPYKMPNILPCTPVYRNEDRIWESTLEKPSAERTIPISITLREEADGYELSAAFVQNSAENRQLHDSVNSHADDYSFTIHYPLEIQAAAKPQRDNIIRNLSKLGGTPFAAQEIHIVTNGERFIPASVITEMRRQLVEVAISQLQAIHLSKRDKRRESQQFSFAKRDFDFTANIANRLAYDYLKAHDAGNVAPAFELKQPTDTPRREGVSLMTCRHCLRYALGQCPRETGRRPEWKEPVSLRLPDGRQFPLRFDCSQCEMHVLAPKTSKAH